MSRYVLDTLSTVLKVHANEVNRHVLTINRICIQYVSNGDVCVVVVAAA